MTRQLKKSFALLITLTVALTVQSACNDDDLGDASNGEFVRSFIENVLQPGDPTLAADYIAADSSSTAPRPTTASTSSSRRSKALAAVSADTR